MRWSRNGAFGADDAERERPVIHQPFGDRKIVSPNQPRPSFKASRHAEHGGPRGGGTQRRIRRT